MVAFPSPMRGFYAIVDPERCAGRDPDRIAHAILDGGCAALQLRAKKLGDAALLALARRISSRCRVAKVPFFINDRPDIALLAGATGIHLGQQDLPLSEVRRVAPTVQLGLSTHDLAQARRAVEQGADLIGFGPIYETSTKDNPDPVVGLDRLEEVCHSVSVPVIAIGGIDAERAADVARTGAAMAAAISAVCGADDPARAAHAIHRAFSERA
jgi:thiamine-phosphate pyrophosphorylase